jgi:hypothetical protein
MPQTHRLQPLQRLVSAIGAVIRINEDVFERDGQLMCEPFQQERRFVFRHRNRHDRTMGTAPLAQFVQYRCVG